MIPIKFNVYPGDSNVSGNKLQNAFDHFYPRRTSEKTLPTQSLIQKYLEEKCRNLCAVCLY